jgi:hypothetical protein
VAVSSFPLVYATSRDGQDFRYLYGGAPPSKASEAGVGYHVVYAFDTAVDDFVLPGLFTREADAAAYAERLKANPGRFAKGTIGVTYQAHEWVVQTLLAVRLGALGDSLKRLEALVSQHTTKLEDYR